MTNPFAGMSAANMGASVAAGKQLRRSDHAADARDRGIARALGTRPMRRGIRGQIISLRLVGAGGIIPFPPELRGGANPPRGMAPIPPGAGTAGGREER